MKVWVIIIFIMAPVDRTAGCLFAAHSVEYKTKRECVKAIPEVMKKYHGTNDNQVYSFCQEAYRKDGEK